ncbi:MAG TPA: M23 family metallopeptidase [Micromonosporaceae bacterium]
MSIRVAPMAIPATAVSRSRLGLPRDLTPRPVIHGPASPRTPGHIGRHRATAPVRHRLLGWLTRLRPARGVLTGTALVATAVLLGSPAVAGVVDRTPATVPAKAAVTTSSAASSAASPAAPNDDGYGWPLAGTPLVTRPFDPPPERWRSGHRGVDLAGRPGLTVRAAGAGVVHFAGWLAGRGVVSIQHTDGLRTTYEPVEPLVAVGDRVRAGDVIGRLTAGHPGCTGLACLHWGLRQGIDYLDPLSLLGLGRVRLLPMSPHAAHPG